MAKVSWDDLTPIDEAPQQAAPSPTPKKKEVSWDDLTPIGTWQPQHGKLYSFLGEIANNIINPINWLLSPLKGATMPGLMGGQSALLNQQGTPTQQPSVAPQLPTFKGTHGVPAFLGDVAGFALPFGAASKALSVGAKLPVIESMVSGLKPGLKSLAKTMGSGAVAGYADTSPDSSRKANALMSAAGGLIGEGGARALGKGFETIPKLLPRAAPEIPPTELETEFENTLSKINQEKRPTSTEASQDLLNSLVRKYSEARQGVRPLYDEVFGGSAKGLVEPMEKSDLKNYRNYRMGLPRYRSAKLLPYRGLETPDMEAVNPQDVHFYKSNLMKLGRKYLQSNPELARNYNEAAEALDYDLGKFLNKQGLGDAYNEAQTQWANKVVPYTSDKNFSQILEHLDKDKLAKFEKAPNIQSAKASGLDEDVIDTTTPNFLKETAPVAKLTSRFLPTHSEYDPGSMEKLGTLLKDKDLAAKHLKNIFYAKHQKTNGFDLGSFLKEMYSKVGKAGKSLSPEQRNFMFTPEERKYWDALDEMHDQYKEIIKGKKAQKLMVSKILPSQIPSTQTGATIGGSMLGRTLGIPGGSIVGGMAGSHLSKLLDKLAPSLLEGIANKNFKVSPRAAKRAGYIGSALGSAPFH